MCAEQQGDERFDVACRVNGDEVGQEEEDTRMLWVMLAPFVRHVRRFLQAWPGLHFKVRLGERQRERERAGDGDDNTLLLKDKV